MIRIRSGRSLLSLALTAGALMTGSPMVMGQTPQGSQSADPEAGAANTAPTAARWETRAPLPEQRTEVSATTDGRYIYLAGGFGPPEGDERATAPRTLWRYDPAADAWTAITEIPQGGHHMPVQYHDGRLFLLGGFREVSFEPMENVRIFDLSTESWSEGAPMPTPRGASGWTVLDGRIHVIGGNAAGPEALEGVPGAEITEDRSVNVHEAYDPATDRWERLRPMPTARNHTGAAAVGGNIHVVLGRADDHYTMVTHEIYDPLTDTWASGPDVPTGRSGVAVLEHDGRLYAFGGERLDEPNRRTFDAAERFDPRSGAWERLPPMPTARHGLGAAVVNGVIHVISGGPQPAFTFGNVHEVLVPDR